MRVLVSPRSRGRATETDTQPIGEYWAQKAHARGAVDSRGKQLRRDGFGMAEERYGLFSLSRTR